MDRWMNVEAWGSDWSMCRHVGMGLTCIWLDIRVSDVLLAATEKYAKEAAAKEEAWTKHIEKKAEIKSKQEIS